MNCLYRIRCIERYNRQIFSISKLHYQSICTSLNHKNELVINNRSKLRSLKRKISNRSLYSTAVRLSTETAQIKINETVSFKPFVDNKFSYAHGRSYKELKPYIIAPLIEKRSQIEPHSTAAVVYDEGISKSFEELNNDINKLVNGLVNELNVKKGYRIGIYSYNNYQFLLVHFACNKLGLIINPFNPSYKAHELSQVLAKSDINILFMPGKNSKQSSLNDHCATICDESLGILQKEGKISNLKNIVVTDGELNEKDLSMTGIKVHRWRSIYSNNPKLDANIRSMMDEVNSDDIYGVYYTSGTTGVPKGAAISQYTVINNVRLSSERLFTQRGPQFQSIRPNVCLPLPLFHEFASVFGILAPFINGGSFVFPGMKYEMNSIFESIIRFKCNTLFCTPTILLDIFSHLENNNIDASTLPLKTILIAGSPVMPELIRKTYKMLPNLDEIRIGYGSSENGVISTLQTTQEPPEMRPYTVGPPLDFTEIRIADQKTGLTTPLGKPGEVQTRGFNTFINYYNEPQKTFEAMTETNWYKTGDMGIIDSNGSLRIVGRIKDVIIKGGENIYPAEVESVLHTHKAINDAHVIGVPDKRYGEEVCVWAKLNHVETNEEDLKKDIIDFCRKKLTYNKIPKYIFFVKEFPLTSVKKIKKFEMRAQTIKMLNLNV